MNEFNRVAARPYGPLAVVDDVVGTEWLERFIVRLSQRADTDPVERSAGRRLVVSDGGFPRSEVFHRAHDGVMQFGVVPLEPLAEVFVSLRAERIDLP